MELVMTANIFDFGKRKNRTDLSRKGLYGFDKNLLLCYPCSIILFNLPFDGVASFWGWLGSCSRP